MKAAVLVKTGSPKEAFEIRDVPAPEISADEVLIRVEGFGLNFADVLARLGLYPDRPPLPTILGYDAVGYVMECGDNVSTLQTGDRVTAFTRFGAYAEFVKSHHLVVSKIPDEMPLGTALALSTQYCTAYYAAVEMVNLHGGDEVLVHSAAGGVGTALVQIAKNKGCTVFGTASLHKLDHCREIGVDHPIDYRNKDFVEEIRAQIGDRGLDVIFDPIGGSSTRKGFRLLGSGGRLVLFGAASMTGAGFFGKLRVASSFGLFHPIQFLANSKSILGVNMLRVGDDRPLVLKRVFDSVVAEASAGALNPVVGKEYPLSELAFAHADLEGRRSIGKLAVRML